MPTRGVVYVHSTPLAVCPHVEWAIARVLTAPVTLHWAAQPVDPGARRTECSWTGRAGTGAELAAALRQWPMIRFEITEEPSPGCDGERFMFVPGRGLFRAATGAAGDIQTRRGPAARDHGAARAPPRRSQHALDKALGTAWDAELEPYRYAGDGAPVTLLTRVG